MSHFARASIHKAVISYDKKYKTSEMVTLRQDYDDGSHKKKYCMVFTGAEGVEGLLLGNGNVCNKSVSIESFEYVSW